MLCSFSLHARELAVIEKSIIIHRPHAEVFAHISNSLNDHTWRSEVNSMEADGPFGIGTTFTEDAHIGLNPHFITRTVLLELSDEHAYYQTPADARFYLSSLRRVESVSPYKCRVTYRVEFDVAMSEPTLGVKLPAQVLSPSYGVIINHYLRNLRAYLE